MAAHQLGARSLSHERRDDGEREIPVEDLNWRPLPRGLARQHEWAHTLLHRLDGDVERLFAAAEECRHRASDPQRTADSRMAYMRATDLCEQALALITARSGPDDAQRALMGRYMADSADTLTGVRYRVMWTLFLPVPRLQDRACMGPISTAQLWARQLRPDRSLRSCCDSHRGDWHGASQAAIGVVSATRRAGLPDAAAPTMVEYFAKDKRWPAPLRAAVECLLVPGLGIEVSTTGGRMQHHDGRHRTHAMLTAGVRRTVVIWGGS
ncbi:hypothetical protein ABZ799_26820 [Nocardiopsis dassonvillei]|uniref:hypothetical protein n=1 Tax=Nocardiopsis dassonvillei TaxID=2014 RepID=UPI0033F4FF48